MTNEEALEQMQKLIVYYHALDMDEPLNIAISALEKQIPMKPHKRASKVTGIMGWYCEKCKILQVGYQASYCARCGQRIDWSEGADE